jgi:hypothetical protein
VGTVDVDGLLGSISREQFDGWIAYDLVEPFGQAWLQTGTIAAVIDSGFAQIAAAVAGQSVRPDQLPRPRDYMPVWRRARRQATGDRGQKKLRVDLASIRASELAGEAQANAAIARRTRAP